MREPRGIRLVTEPLRPQLASETCLTEPLKGLIKALARVVENWRHQSMGCGVPALPLRHVALGISLTPLGLCCTLLRGLT